MTFKSAGNGCYVSQDSVSGRGIFLIKQAEKKVWFLGISQVAFSSGLYARSEFLPFTYFQGYGFFGKFPTKGAAEEYAAKLHKAAKARKKNWG